MTLWSILNFILFLKKPVAFERLKRSECTPLDQPLGQPTIQGGTAAQISSDIRQEETVFYGSVNL
jgi:hypothetical protein